MKFRELHDWPKNPKDALRIQKEISELLIRESCFDKLEYITGVDTAFDDKKNRIFAAAVTMKYPEMVDTERAVADMEMSFPYIPGLLGFREGPVILKTLSRLSTKPDLVIFAGHGLAHPRGIGMAAHLGLLIDTPSIGCARRPLVGVFDEPSVLAGEYTLISIENVECGFVYRSRAGVKPIYISPGHKCSLADALRIIKDCLDEYRMPMPLRLAHLFANKYRRSRERKNREKKASNKNSEMKNKILNGSSEPVSEETIY